MPENR